MKKSMRETIAAAAKTPFESVVEEVAEMLIQKNRAYGDSALAPLRVFSKADPIEQLRVRIDDKLSRLSRGSEAGEDTVLDLIGYLVMFLIAQRRAAGIDRRDAKDFGVDL